MCAADIPETPRRGSGGGRSEKRLLQQQQLQQLQQQQQVQDTGLPGLQCHSCGSLLHPERGECAAFSASNSSQRQACLLYTWSRSATETAQLRECFPTRVLLGSISAPLAPATLCTERDITDDGSGSIRACLCTTDLCNHVPD